MKKVVFFIAILIALFIINGLVQSILNLSQKNSVIEKARHEMLAQEKENKRLRQQLDTVKEPSFLEEEARNKLFLVKPGEQVVLIPSPSVTPTSPQHKRQMSTKPNWEQWYEYFL